MTDSGPPSPTPAPRQLSYYRLEARLGAGGMGEVHRAIDIRTGRAVAVKLMHPHLAAAPAFRERFQREAHLATLLHSPYVVHLLDYGDEDGVLYLVTEFVEGAPLDVMLRDGPLTPDRALRFATHVARALEEAEARGIVHRDIKPANIIVGRDGTARVLDFGIARALGAPGLTVAGGFVGSPLYAAPEAFRGELDARSDLYSLGATLYHMLAGRPPFEGDADALARQHRDSPVPAIPLQRVPPGVVAVVRRCLAKDPAERYPSAADLARELDVAAAALGALLPASPSDETVAGAPVGPALVLGPPRRSRWRPWRARYDLFVTNHGEGALVLALEAAATDGTVAFSAPLGVDLGPGESRVVPLVASSPPWRRGGRGGSRGFRVSASVPGSTRSYTVYGEYPARSMRGPLLASLGGAAVLLVSVGAAVTWHGAAAPPPAASAPPVATASVAASAPAPAAGAAQPTAAARTAAAATPMSVASTQSDGAPRGTRMYAARLDGTSADIRDQWNQDATPGASQIRFPRGAIEVDVLKSGGQTGATLNTPVLDNYVADLAFTVSPGSQLDLAWALRDFGSRGAVLADVAVSDGTLRLVHFISCAPQPCQPGPPAPLSAAVPLPGLLQGDVVRLTAIVDGDHYTVLHDGAPLVEVTEADLSGPATAPRFNVGGDHGSVRIVGAQVYALAAPEGAATTSTPPSSVPTAVAVGTPATIVVPPGALPPSP